MVAKNKDHLARLSGVQAKGDVVRTNRLPAVGDGISGLTVFNRQGRIPAAIGAEEGFALGVEASDR